MAMLVSTKPPELIVRTKIKKVPIRRDVAPFLCDRFWECVLNDYLEDEENSDDGIVAISPTRVKEKLKEKSSQNKRKEKKKRKEAVKEIVEEDVKEDVKEVPNELSNEVSKETSQEAPQKPKQEPVNEQIDEKVVSQDPPDPEAVIGRELETLLSDTCEVDVREKDDVESPRMQDGQLESDRNNARQGTAKHFGLEEKRNRYQTLENRVSSAPADFELASQRYSKSRDHGPEVDADLATSSRRKKSGDVIHYAPLYHGQKGRKSTNQVPRSSPLPQIVRPPTVNQSEVSHVNVDPRSTRSRRRVAVDPDEYKPISVRHLHSRDGHDELSPVGHSDFANNNLLTHLPRGPSGSRGGQQFHSRPVAPRTILASKQQKSDGSRVQTIDLTNETFHEEPVHAAKQGRSKHDNVDVNGKLKSYEDTVSWMLLESKKAESEYRRRKLDRKEALHRIRAIKARLQTVDP